MVGSPSCGFPVAVLKFPICLSSRCYLALVALACIVRPTAAIPWAPLLLWHFGKESNKRRFLWDACLPVG